MAKQGAANLGMSILEHEITMPGGGTCEIGNLPDTQSTGRCASSSPLAMALRALTVRGVENTIGEDSAGSMAVCRNGDVRR